MDVGEVGSGARMRGRRNWARSAGGERRPDQHRQRAQWVSGPMFREWRDVGIRGYLPSGLRDEASRRSQSGRDAAFVDLMFRTGLRLTEQSSLLTLDIPERDPERAFVRKQLPAIIAKNFAGRDIYYPSSVLLSIDAYLRGERREAIELARSAGGYVVGPDSWVMEDLSRPVAVNLKGTKVEVSKLLPKERARLLIAGERGLEPGSLWLGIGGQPMASKSWQSVLTRANARCERQGVQTRVHPHMLRHSYAVLTLEQLQRQHLQILAEHGEAYRSHYRMVYGDPLDFVKSRLGHQSVVTTHIYLHTLDELENETKLLLIGDSWSIPEPEDGSESLERFS